MNYARHLRTGVLMTAVTTLLCGVLYPIVVTGVAQALFPELANGQIVSRAGRAVGSRLIGQPFSSPGYFHPRPSGAGAGYDGVRSGGTNLGPTSRQLIDSVRSRVEQARRENPGARVPVDLVTASGSGLDPHLSPAAALFQAARVAAARGVAAEDVRGVVFRRIEGRQFGILGEPRVNVLELNLALDDLWPPHR
jgi:K+-transporting ATPase ATPase C chain